MALIRLMLLFSLLVLILQTALADGIDIDDPDTTVLTAENFDSFTRNDLSLVEFYAPWCGHCKALAPEFAAAASELSKDVPAIKLGKVDATVEGALAGPINSYPTLKIFRNGKAFDYNGPRDAKGIVAYMRKQVGPAAKLIQNQSDLDRLLESDNVNHFAIVGFFNAPKQSQLHSAFNLISSRLRDEYTFGKVVQAPELATMYGVDPNGDALISFLSGEKFVYKGDSKQKNVENFIRQHSIPLVGLLNDATVETFAKRGLPVAKLFMKVDKAGLGTKAMRYYTNRIRKIAEHYNGQLQFALADNTQLNAQRDYFNINSDDFAFIIEDYASKQSYRFEGDATKFTPIEYKAFVEDFVNGELKPYVRSERLPKEHGSVRIVVGSTFDKEVIESEDDVLIEFYAPWCGHCKALEPKYEQLAERVKRQGLPVKIAKIDATANDFPRDVFQVNGYPTLYYKAVGKKPVLYEKGHDVDEIFKFIKKRVFKNSKSPNRKVEEL